MSSSYCNSTSSQRDAAARRRPNRRCATAAIAALAWRAAAFKTIYLASRAIKMVNRYGDPTTNPRAHAKLVTYLNDKNHTADITAFGNRVLRAVNEKDVAATNLILKANAAFIEDEAIYKMAIVLLKGM